MKKFLFIFGLVMTLIMGGTVAQAANTSDKDGVIYFSGNSAKLSTSAKKEIKAFVDANPGAGSFSVTGYVQQTKSNKNDLTLSLARAHSVRDYMSSIGVKVQILTAGNGIPPTKGKSTKARRVEINANAPLPSGGGNAAPASYSVQLGSTTPIQDVQFSQNQFQDRTLNKNKYLKVNFSTVIKTNGFLPNLDCSAPNAPVNPTNMPLDFSQFSKCITFDYVKPDGSLSTNNSVPTIQDEFSTISVKPNSTLTVKIDENWNQILSFGVLSLPTSCVEFNSGEFFNGIELVEQLAPNGITTKFYTTISLNVTGNDCRVDFSRPSFD